MSDVFKSFSLPVSLSKKGVRFIVFFPPRKIFRLRKFSKEALGLSFSLWHFYAHIISYFVIKLRKKAAGLQIIVNERCRDIRLQISDFRRLISDVSQSLSLLVPLLAKNLISFYNKYRKWYKKGWD